MSRFSRPAGAITDATELRDGDRIWRVYGIWPPQIGGEHVVTKPPAPFAEHAEYTDIHAAQQSLIVFDVRWLPDGKKPHMEFASDGNLIPGWSHNDNYWFRSEADAIAAVEFLHSQWKANPDLILAENARREFDKRWDFS